MVLCLISCVSCVFSFKHQYIWNQNHFLAGTRNALHLGCPHYRSSITFAFADRLLNTFSPWGSPFENWTHQSPAPSLRNPIFSTPMHTTTKRNTRFSRSTMHLLILSLIFTCIAASTPMHKYMRMHRNNRQITYIRVCKSKYIDPLDFTSLGRDIRDVHSLRIANSVFW